MRYIVDISPNTLDAINIFIQKGEYRTVQEFISTAIQNQIYLIEQPESSITISRPSQIRPSEIFKESKSDSTSLLDLRNFKVETKDEPKNMGKRTLSGFWNKFLPVKITLRVLANMQHGNKTSVLLDMLQENASVEARKLGQTLVRKERGSGRKRGDRLFTALPVKRSGDKSRLRFKSHFVGSLSGGKIDGMPGALELLHISKGSDGKDYVSISERGLSFAGLPNPIIDNNDYNSTLSEEEKAFLVAEIRSRLPDEYEAIRSVLKLIEEGNADTKTLLGELKKTHPELSHNKLTIFLSGMLNRLADLGLVTRIFEGLAFKYEVSEKGKNIGGGGD